jgi:hypothetical protein
MHLPYTPFSPSRRLYPPGRSPLRDGVEPEAASHFKKVHHLFVDDKNSLVFQRFNSRLRKGQTVAENLCMSLRRHYRHLLCCNLHKILRRCTLHHDRHLPARDLFVHCAGNREEQGHTFYRLHQNSAAHGDARRYVSRSPFYVLDKLTEIHIRSGIPLTGYRSSSYLFMVLLAIVPQLIGHTSINWALKHLKASMIAITILGEPIGA